MNKPRPVVIVQDDRFDATNSVTVCGLTTATTDASYVRVAVEPGEANGLDAASEVMVDKITTVRRERLGQRIGRLGDDDVGRLNRAILLFLGIADPPRTSAP